MNQNDFINELNKLNIEFDNNKLEQLEKYYELLIEYNKVMNLTGIVEKKEVYLKHFYDSLTICREIDLEKYNNLCDVGTGAGFPGIVLKIFFPNLKITLVDSLNKRIKFLNTVINLLELKNIEAIHCRVEEFAHSNRNKYEIVTARAVAPLNILLEYCIPITKENYYFIPLKGKIESDNEYTSALNKLNTDLINIDEFLLPYEGSNRAIYIFKKNKDVKKYPRKYSEMLKKHI